MTTRLEKITLQSYTPGTPGQPGSPGQPALPARTVFRTVEVCNFVPYTRAELDEIYRSYGATYVNVGPPTNEYVLVPPSGGSVQIPTGRLVCNDVVQRQEFPAQNYIPPTPPVPATPAQTQRDFQIGWNSRARSISPMVGSGRFSFRIPSSVVGVIVGLSPDPRDTNFSDIRWGFRVSGGLLSIIEDGVVVAPVGAHASADQLSIQRSAGEITYRVGTTVVRTTPNEGSPMYLSAALYSGGDSVSEASLEEFASGSGMAMLQGFQAFGGTEPYAIGSEVIGPFMAEGSADATGSGDETFGPFSAFGADAAGYAIGQETIGPFTALGEGIEELTYAIGAETLLPFTVSSSGLTGGAGEASESLGPFDALGAETADLYSTGRAEIAGFSAYGENFGLETDASMFSLVFAPQESQAQQEIFVLMNSALQIESLVVTTMVVPATMSESLSIADPTTVQQEIEAMLQSLMRASVSAGDPSAIEQRSVWALSLDAMGSTRYDDFDFNSFAEVNGRYFGMRSDGLYLLQGPSDNGEQIDARINFGRPNMGDMRRKALPYVYVGAASDGTLILKVVAEGKTYYYRASGDGDEIKTHRFTPGLGLRATNYELEIQNSDGGAFDVASIEFVPVQLNRRI